MTAKRPGLETRDVPKNGVGDAGPDNAAGPVAEQAKPASEAPDGTGEAEPMGSRPEGAAAGDQASVLKEIHGMVRVIAERTVEPGAGTGLSKEDIDQLTRAVETLGDSAGETRSLVERLAAQSPPNEAAAKVAADLTKGMRTHREDFGRWVGAERRARRRWLALALAAAVPAALLFGVLLEMRFQLIPLHDSSGGWREIIWHEYGRQIVGCEYEAKRIRAKVDCPLVVNKP